jgi:ribosomal protein S12 methylthiotransferase accessory factor YcaO
MITAAPRYRRMRSSSARSAERDGSDVAIGSAAALNADEAARSAVTEMLEMEVAHRRALD